MFHKNEIVSVWLILTDNWLIIEGPIAWIDGWGGWGGWGGGWRAELKDLTAKHTVKSLQWLLGDRLLDGYGEKDTVEGRMARAPWHCQVTALDCVDCVDSATNTSKQSWRPEWFEIVDARSMRTHSWPGHLRQEGSLVIWRNGKMTFTLLFPVVCCFLAKSVPRAALLTASNNYASYAQHHALFVSLPCRFSSLSVDLSIYVSRGLECTDLIFAVDICQEIEEIGQTMPKCKR